MPAVQNRLGYGMIYGNGLNFQLPAGLALRLQWQNSGHDDKSTQLISLSVIYDNILLFEASVLFVAMMLNLR